MARRVPRGAVAAAALALVLARPAPAADAGTPSDPAGGEAEAFAAEAWRGLVGCGLVDEVLREAIYGTLDPRPDAELAPVLPIEPPTGTRPATPDG